MNFLIFIAAVVLILSTTKAETLTTQDGEQITGEVRKVTPDGIVVLTDSGVHKVPFKNLPEETRQKYGYNPDVENQYRAKIEAARLQARLKEEAEAKEYQETLTPNESNQAEELHFLVVGIRKQGVLADKMEPHENSTVRRMKATGNPMASGMVPAGVSREGLAAAMEPVWEPSGVLVFVKGSFSHLAEGDRKVVTATRKGSCTIRSQKDGETRTIALYQGE